MVSQKVEAASCMQSMKYVVSGTAVPATYFLLAPTEDLRAKDLVNVDAISAAYVSARGDKGTMTSGRETKTGASRRESSPVRLSTSIQRSKIGGLSRTSLRVTPSFKHVTPVC